MMMMIIIINIINEGGEMERVVARWDQQVQRLPQAAAQPNLTEVFYTQPKGQKRNCACTHHFWGTVYPNLT